MHDGAYRYRCALGNLKVNRDNHPKYSLPGSSLDWAVWRKIVDDGIRRPEIIREQVMSRQAALRAQGDSLDGDINRIRTRLDELGGERAAYQRMFARKKISEDEFDRQMDETEEASRILQDDLEQLKTLRDDRGKIDASLLYARQLFDAFRNKLAEIDQSPEELETMSEDDRFWVLERRQEIIRAMVDRAVLYSDGTVMLEGVLDGSEISKFDINGS
jgi:uncharacterized protein YukE